MRNLILCFYALMLFCVTPVTAEEYADAVHGRHLLGN